MLRLCRGPVRPRTEFLLAQATTPGDRCVDLLAQLRASGRILDACRLVVGGSEVIQVDIDLHRTVPIDRFKQWRIRYQIWPRDVVIRRNQATGDWVDVEALVAGRDAEIVDAGGAFIPPNEFLAILAEQDPPRSASIRWAVVIADDGGVHLQLQTLPGSPTVLNGKPMLRK